NLKSLIKPDANVLVSGHFPAIKYNEIFPKADLVTFLRYPVNQVLSHFRHHVARHGFKGGLREFCNNPVFCNLQSRYLAGVPVERFSFVGILECLALDLVTLSEFIGTRLTSLHLNRLDVLPAIPVTQTEIAMIEARNSADMTLYAAALAIRGRSRPQP